MDVNPISNFSKLVHIVNECMFGAGLKQDYGFSCYDAGACPNSRDCRNSEC